MKKAGKNNEQRPANLNGKRIAITRTREKNSVLAQRLHGVGAEVIELPLIRIVHEDKPVGLNDVLDEFGAYEWIIFTSANGVESFFRHFFDRFSDIRALGLARIAVIGRTTEAAVRKLHLNVDVIPEEAVAEALADALEAYGSLDNLRVLVVTGNQNRPVLIDRLVAARAIVDKLAVYRTERTDLSDHPDARTFRKDGADAIIFASTSAVHSFVAQAGALTIEPGGKKPLGCSIGPITSESMRQCGIPVDLEAEEACIDGLVDALQARLVGG